MRRVQFLPFPLEPFSLGSLVVHQLGERDHDFGIFDHEKAGELCGLCERRRYFLVEYVIVPVRIVYLACSGESTAQPEV